MRALLILAAAPVVGIGLGLLLAGFAMVMMARAALDAALE